MVPAEGVAIEIAVFLPTDDVALRVVNAWIHRINTSIRANATVGVVGQRAIDPTLFVNINPLWAVHFGGTEQIGSLTSLDDHFALVFETTCCGEFADALHQWQPHACAISVELGDIQNAIVEQVAVGLRGGLRGRRRLDFVLADKFVDVFKARIFTGIHHGVTTLGNGDRCAFMCCAAHCCALDGCCGGIHWINFDDPAEAVYFIGVLDGVEALVMLVPTVAPAVFGQTPAALLGTDGVATIKVADEVFFAGEVGAPRRTAAAAVVERTQSASASGICSRLHQCMTSGWTSNGHGRIASDTAGKPRGANHFPVATGFAYFDDGDAVSCLRFLDLLSTPSFQAIAVQQTIIGVLMVHHQEAVLASSFALAERIVVNAIVMHAHLHFLLSGGVGGIEFKRRHITSDPDGLAPRCERLRGVALWHGDAVFGRDGYAFETDQRSCARCRTAGGAACQPAKNATGSEPQAAAQDQAASGIRNVMNTRVGGRIGVFHM